uniref:Uncharacterized protein n=1 Tax=uncultured marine virus TaxID=186617 RepID=A0A0F7L3F9_9VIRU|nr:hypothetical protein [uncultured marine virus]
MTLMVSYRDKCVRSLLQVRLSSLVRKMVVLLKKLLRLWVINMVIIREKGRTSGLLIMMTLIGILMRWVQVMLGPMPK